MDRNYYIRIVLEARDNLSKAIKDAVDKGNRDFAVLGNRVKALDTDFNKLEKSVDKVGQSVNRNRNFFLRFADGVNAARDRTSKLSPELAKAGGNMTRFGFFVRQTVRDVDRFINLRWLLVVSFLVTMGNALVVVGANLLSVAASATRAASALGGVLVAGIAQLIPVLALLQATMARLDKVMDAVDASEKARIANSQDAVDQARAQQDAEEQLADAKYGLLQANEAVLDAEIDLKNARLDVIEAEEDHARAVQDLARARREAAENIADSRLEEREAALALEEAELGVLDAKRALREEENRARLGDQNLDFARAEVRNAQERLKIVTSQGDQAEISSATQALNFAENNLNAILNSAETRTQELQQKQLDVEQAEVNRDQAVLRNKRTQREGRETRALGVEGSDEVIAALDRVEDSERGVADARRAVTRQTRQLRDANHNVTVAMRQLARAHRDASDAAKNQSSSEKALTEALADLTPAERGLVRAITRFKRVAEREFGPIQDIIIRAFTRAVKAAEQILLDPRIQKAARKLAQSIAGVIDLFSEFSKTDEFRDSLAFFTEQAAENVPKIGEAFLDLLRILMRVGRAATPLFNDLLDRMVKLFDRMERGTRDEGKLRRFFNAAGEHLDAWINLAVAVGNVFKAFAFDTGAADSGLTLLRDITDLLNEWAAWIRENPEIINGFFEDMRVQLEALGAVFGRVAVILFNVFRSEEAAAFSELILETFVPAFELLVTTLGALSKIMLFVFDIPVVGTIAKWIVIGGLFYGMLNRLFAITGILGREGFGKLFKQISDNNSAFRRLARSMVHPLQTFKELRGVVKGKIEVLKTYAGVIQGQLNRAWKGALERASLFNAYLKDGIQRLKNKTIEAGKLALTLAGRLKQGFITAMTSLLNFTRAMGAAAVSTMRRFASFIAVQVVNALRLLRLNIRLLIGATGIGLLLLAAGLIIEHWDKVKAFLGRLLKEFQRFIDWIRDNWKTIAKIIGLVFLGPAGALFLIYKFRDKIFEVFRNIVKAVKGFFGDMIDWIKEKILGIGDAIVKKAKDVVDRIKGVFGGSDLEGEVEADANTRANKVLETKAFDKVRPRIKRMRARGMKGLEILNALIEEGFISDAQVAKIAKRQNFALGGAVQGAAGAAVPIMAHAGEWVLNKIQQSKLAERLGTTREQAAMWLFGTAGRSPATSGPRQGRNQAAGLRGGTDQERFFKFANVNLIGQVDEGSTDAAGNPVTVWFVEMADGAFGQVSARDAARIQRTNGAWVPNYVKRSSHGFIHNIQRTKKYPGRLGGIRGGGFEAGGIVPSFAMGGIVPSAQSMSEGGGITLNSPNGPGGGPRIGEFKQHFEVKAESPMDWNYIFRLGALHAQGSY